MEWSGVVWNHAYTKLMWLIQKQLYVRIYRTMMILTVGLHVGKPPNECALDLYRFLGLLQKRLYVEKIWQVVILIAGVHPFG